MNRTTSCVPERAHTELLPESTDVGPPVIPSLMSIQTSTPSNDIKSLTNNNNTRNSIPSLMNIETRPPSEMRNNETKFQVISAPRMNRTTSRLLPESADVGPPVIPSLASIQTSPPSNDTKSLTNNNNTRTSIPSLMSIETRPPWEIRNNETNMSSLEDLQKTVTAQRELINVLTCDRNWLEGENNIKSAALNRLNQTIKEYEKYIQQREAEMALEIKHWKNKYYIKKEECKSLKTGWNFGGALRVRVYGGDVGCSAMDLEQRFTNFLWRISKCAAPSRGLNIDRLALPATTTDQGLALPAPKGVFDSSTNAAEVTEVNKIEATVSKDMGLGTTLPTEVAAVSAHPAEELRTESISTSKSLVKLDFTPYDREQPLKEIEVSSGKKKKSRAARFRRWLKRFCCCSSSAQEEKSF